MGQRTNLLLQVERFGKPSEEGVCSLFRGEERSANGHGRSGARLNRVYHLQWGYRKYLPMAFLRLLSSRYFKPQKTDIFEFFTRGLDLDSLDMIERDWNKYDFNKLEECQEALSHCDNNNGAMVVVITEDARDYYHPKYKLGFLLGPEHLEGEHPSPVGSRPKSTCDINLATKANTMTSSPTPSMPSPSSPELNILYN